MVCFRFGDVVGQYAQIVGLSGAFWGRFEEHILELEGPKRPFNKGKSSCMIRVATISLLFAVFNRIYDGLGKNKLILALSCKF